MVKEIITFLLNPLMNQRGQYIPTPLGVSQPYAGLGVPGSAEETREYSPFVTSAPSPQYGDLIARYQALLGGGAGGIQSYLDLQRKTGLEQLRNTQAARGLGSRSGVGVAAASQFLGQFEPRAAATMAEYMQKLIGDYGTAVSQGRTQQMPVLSKAMRQEGPTQTTAGGAGAAGGSPFQYIPSSPFGGGGGGGGGSTVSGGGRTSGGFFPTNPSGGSLENFLSGFTQTAGNTFGPQYDKDGKYIGQGWGASGPSGASLGPSFGGGDSGLIGPYGSATAGQSQYYDPLSGNYDLMGMNEDYRRSMGF